MVTRIKRTNPNLKGMLNQLMEPDRGIARDLLRRGYKVEAQAKRNLGQNNKTGTLRDSIHTSLEIKNNKPVVIVGTPLFYARFIHDGTVDHGPVTAKRMAWYGPDGNIIFAKWVRGIRANPFLRDALIAVPD